MLDVLHDTDPIQVHGYSMAGGFDGTRRAVAEDLTRRFGIDHPPGGAVLLPAVARRLP